MSPFRKKMCPVVNSPAIDEGSSLVSSLVTTDYEGNSRPQPAGGAYDIGAYEFVSGSSGDITTGLLSRWTFDNTLTDSAGTNHGIFTGGTPSYTSGKLNQALVFDGVDDEVDIVDYNPGGADFSVGGWINITATGSDFQPIAGNNQNTPLLGYRPSTNQIVSLVQDSTGNETITWTAPAPLENTGWHHIVLVARDSIQNQVEVFLNGTSLGAQPITRSYTASNGSFRKIGRDFGTTLQGSLDDVRLYSRVLSATDIQALYAFGGSTPCTWPHESGHIWEALSPHPSDSF
jgi:hypothetical protein